MRIDPSSARCRACSTKARPAARAPPAAARKSLRRLSRSTTAEPQSRSRTEALAPTRPPRRDDLAAAVGRHAGAKTVPALAHQFARLVGSFHGIFSAARRTRVRLQLLGQRQNSKFQCGRAIGAAYTGPLPARQCDAAPDRRQLCALDYIVRVTGPRLRRPALRAVHPRPCASPDIWVNYRGCRKSLYGLSISGPEPRPGQENVPHGGISPEV
jgi:hypothetical protein